MNRVFYWLFGCIITLYSSSTFSQGRFSMSITGGPSYSYVNSRYTVLLPDNNGQFYTATVSGSTSSFGYTAGALMHYKFTPKWSVSAGVWYNRQGQDGINPFLPGNIAARIISQNTQVPLLINYRSSRHRLSPYFSLGGLVNFRHVTSYRSETSTGPEEDKVLLGKHAADVRVVAGAGITYALTHHWSLIAQPLLVWRFHPAGDYQHYIAYQLNGQCQLLYTF